MNEGVKIRGKNQQKSKTKKTIGKIKKTIEVDIPEGNRQLDNLYEKVDKQERIKKQHRTRKGTRKSYRIKKKNTQRTTKDSENNAS